MLEKIKAAVEKLRTNVEHRAPVADALEAIHEAVADLETRLAKLEGKAPAEAAEPVASGTPAAPIIGQ